jgi:MFS family permease
VIRNVIEKSRGRRIRIACCNTELLWDIETLNSHLRRLLPAYIVLLLWTTSWSVSIMGPVMPLYVSSLGIGVMGWSLLAMSAGLGMFLFEWVWGALSDSVDRRALMAAAFLSMSFL